MHRLASRALYDHKGLTGISLTGKPIRFIKEAFASGPVNIISNLYSKLATVAQISLYANGKHQIGKLNVALSFPCIFYRPAREPVITYPGVRTSN